MKYKHIKIIGDTDALLDVAFKRARKTGKETGRISRHLQRKKDIEANKIKIVESYIREKIDEAVVSFPDIESLHPFYKEMLTAVIDIGLVKKSLGHIGGITKMMRKFRLESISAIYRADKPEDVRKIRAGFYGRVSSLIKRAKKSFKTVREIGYELKNMPVIDFDTVTVVLAGFPNSGKTTVLKRLTDSKPKIAEYPFTTKNLNIGYFQGKFLRVQVIDSPGILDREEKKRNLIEKRAISALNHLGGLMLFVVDPTETSGFPLNRQLKLLKELETKFKFPIIVAINKSDIATQEQIDAVKTEHEKIITGETVEGELKEVVCKSLKIELPKAPMK